MKFFKVFFVFFVLIIILMLISLPDYSMASEDYYPLKEGKTWTYQISMTNRFGSTSGLGKMIVTNFTQRELKGEKVTPQKYDFLGQTTFTFIAENDEGIYVFAEQTLNSIEPEIKDNSDYFIMKPIQVGKTWSSATESMLLEKEVSLLLKNTIESTDEIVTVPAGTFKNCLKISSKGSIKKDLGGFTGVANITIEDYSWYASGVGIVKLIRKEKSNHLMVGSGQFTMQLESFKR